MIYCISNRDCLEINNWKVGIGRAEDEYLLHVCNMPFGILYVRSYYTVCTELLACVYGVSEGDL